MSTQRPIEDIIKELEDQIDIYKKESEGLTEKIKQNKIDLQTAHEKLKSDQIKIKAAEEKYRKAIDLKNGEYQGIISEIFEKPQEKILEEIKQESNKSNNWTSLIAIISIIITVLISLLMQNSTNNNTDRRLKEINTEITSFKDDFYFLKLNEKIINDTSVIQIVKKIKSVIYLYNEEIGIDSFYINHVSALLSPNDKYENIYFALKKCDFKNLKSDCLSCIMYWDYKAELKFRNPNISERITKNLYKYTTIKE